MRLNTLLISAAAVQLAACQSKHGNLTVAMVRSPPPNWPLPILNANWTGMVLNISQTVEEGIELIDQAAEKGANLITFPELWFPG